jgi:hypothetical protein
VCRSYLRNAVARAGSAALTPADHRFLAEDVRRDEEWVKRVLEEARTVEAP